MKRLLLFKARYLLYLFVPLSVRIAEAQTAFLKLTPGTGQPWSGISVIQNVHLPVLRQSRMEFLVNSLFKSTRNR